MAQQSRANLKGRTETGDTADTTIFADIIDSSINLADSTAQTITSPVTIPTFAATTVSAATIQVTNLVASATAQFNSMVVGAGGSAGGFQHGGVGVFIITTEVSVNQSAGKRKTIFGMPKGGSYIVDGFADVRTAFEASANAALKIGSSGATIMGFCPLSAVGRERLQPTSGRSFQGGPDNDLGKTKDYPIQAWISAVGTQPDTGACRFTLMYCVCGSAQASVSGETI